jgi:site-specific DNA-methyltransferase (adenine-specific)
LSADLWDAGCFLPPLIQDEYNSLKESIRQYGVRIPIVVDQAGKVIDGRHRQQACDELGIYCSREVREFATDAERLEVAISLNANRRHLNRQQRRELIGTYLKCDPRINDRHLGDIVGASKNTVAAERHRMESTGQIDQLPQRMGRDGKERPATYRRSIITNSAKEAETAIRVLGDLPKNCEGKTLDITTAKRRAAKQRNKVEREERPVVPLAEWSVCPVHRHSNQPVIFRCLWANENDLVLRAAIARGAEELYEDQAHSVRGICRLSEMVG